MSRPEPTAWPEQGLWISRVLTGGGIAVVCAFAAFKVASGDDGLDTADHSTWLYQTLGPEGMSRFLFVVLVLLGLYGVYRVASGIRGLRAGPPGGPAPPPPDFRP